MRYIPSTPDGKSFRPSSRTWDEVVATPDGTKTTTQTRDNRKAQLDKVGLNGFDALFLWFDKENEKCFDFEFLGSEIVNERDVYKVRAAVKTDRKRAGKICESSKKNLNSTIWIDRETMQVVRLLTDPIEISISLIGKMFIRGNYFNIQRYDYAPILVGKEHWWLPVAGRYQIKRDEQLMLEQEREFRNYRMFTSSVKINYESLSK